MVMFILNTNFCFFSLLPSGVSQRWILNILNYILNESYKMLCCSAQSFSNYDLFIVGWFAIHSLVLCVFSTGVRIWLLLLVNGRIPKRQVCRWVCCLRVTVFPTQLDLVHSVLPYLVTHFFNLSPDRMSPELFMESKKGSVQGPKWRVAYC